MVGRFLRLRFALFVAGFRTGNVWRSISTLLGLLVSLGFGVTGLVAGSALRAVPEPWQTFVVQIAMALILLVWLVGPITIAGTDAAMDPVKFVLLPLSRGQLAAGLSVAALVGPGGVATVLTLLGVVIGLTRSVGGAVLVILGAILFALMCAVASRLLISLVGLGLRTRGTRDLLAVVVPLAVVVLAQTPNLISQVVAQQGPQAFESALESLVRVLRFLPSSFAAEAMLAGRDSQWGTGLLELAGGVVAVAVLGYLWSLLLRRVMTTPPATEGATRSTNGRRVPFGAILAKLPPRARGVATKDIKLMLREPSQRVQLIIVGVFAAVAALAPAIWLRGQPLAAFIVCAVALLLGMTNANMYGYDGSSHWVNVAAGDDARADLSGKLAARLLLLTPALLVLAFVPSLIIAPALTVAVAGLTLGIWFVSIGLALCQSVIAPYPIVYSEDSVMPRNQGSMLAAVAQIIALPVIGVACGPFLYWAMTNTDRPLIATAAGLASTVCGALVCWGLWFLAVRISADRQPELLSLISKRAEA